MATKEPTYRAIFNISQAKALYKILTLYPLDGEDMEEAMVIERLKKRIADFLTLNTGNSREEIKAVLNNKVAENYDWDAEFKKLDDQFNDPKFQAKPEDLKHLKDKPKE